MKPLILILGSFLTINTWLSAQNTNHLFDLVIPQSKVRGSLYNSLEFMDARPDPSFMGIVQIGALNKKVPVSAARPLEDQFQEFMGALLDSTASEGTLLFQLRQLYFAEITGSLSEKGYCYMRVGLYAKNGDKYEWIETVDTVMVVSGVDVTKPMFGTANNRLTSLFKFGMKQTPNKNIAYTYNELLRIDSIEKHDIPLYAATEFKDGVYTTYSSFSNQVPDHVLMPEIKNNFIVSVGIPDAKGRKITLRPEAMYAFVYKGKPYIATDYGYYALKKVGEDFHFRGKVKVTASSGSVVLAGAFFGLMGALIAGDAADRLDLRIDHINGGFVPLHPFGEEKSKEK